MYINFGIINCHLFEGMIQIRNKTKFVIPYEGGTRSAKQKRIYHEYPLPIPKKNSDKEKINAEDIFGYIHCDWYISYPGKFRESHIPLTFWDIPRISHVPKKWKKLDVPEILWDIPGISHIPKK